MRVGILEKNSNVPQFGYLYARNVLFILGVGIILDGLSARSVMVKWLLTI